MGLRTRDEALTAGTVGRSGFCQAFDNFYRANSRPHCRAKRIRARVADGPKPKGETIPLAGGGMKGVRRTHGCGLA